MALLAFRIHSFRIHSSPWWMVPLSITLHCNHELSIWAFCGHIYWLFTKEWLGLGCKISNALPKSYTRQSRLFMMEPVRYSLMFHIHSSLSVINNFLIMQHFIKFCNLYRWKKPTCSTQGNRLFVDVNCAGNRMFVDVNCSGSLCHCCIAVFTVELSVDCSRFSSPQINRIAKPPRVSYIQFIALCNYIALLCNIPIDNRVNWIIKSAE